MKLVLASHNQGKLQELAAILEPAIPGLELVSYDGPEPVEDGISCLLYTSPSPRDRSVSRMPSSA